jgi:hypothetical protein
VLNLGGYHKIRYHILINKERERIEIAAQVSVLVGNKANVRNVLVGDIGRLSHINFNEPSCPVFASIFFWDEATQDF